MFVKTCHKVMGKLKHILQILGTSKKQNKNKIT